ncbi:MAG: alcohol dehydrogenase catalytic domain-containing protein [Nitrososphaerota archaeon]|nr:alcohol dehydrogenase catalytic domain-containing protein [Candidatus Bathyarchaeota archaeon]MDW8048335.1 alcohol dehydrogenase catalytic domain-containing protein [Nitrososphaerota archaeon]
MRCAVLERPGRLIVGERAVPRVGDGDVLIRVAACAICGTDIKKYFRGHKLIKSYPIVPGHELVGEIVEVGRNVREFDVDVDGEKEKRVLVEGEKVVIAPVIACERCINCREGRPESCNFREDFGFNYDGGFEEYALIPEKLLRKKINPVIPVPENVPLYMAAISEPFACALHSHKKLVRPGRWKRSECNYDLIQGIREGDVVVIIGGGPLGCMHAELAKSSGASIVIIAQHSEWRLNMIKKLGVADYYVLNKDTSDLIDSINQITDGRGADVVITAASSSEAQVQALKIVRQGGVVSFFGGVDQEAVEIPTNKIHYNGPFITGTSGASPYHIPIVLKLMADGKIDATKYVTHVLGLDYLERVLMLLGTPNFISVDEIISSRGEDFLSFLNNPELRLEEFPSLPEKVQVFKGSILKALVTPSNAKVGEIRSLLHMSVEERREALIKLIG